MRPLVKIGTLALLVTFLIASPARGQGKVSGVILIEIPAKKEPQHNVEAEFTESLVDPADKDKFKAPTTEQVTIVTKKGGTISQPLKVIKVSCVTQTCKLLTVDYDPTILPDPEDTQFDIVFTKLSFKDGVVDKVVASGKIYRQKDTGTLVKEALAAQKAEVAKVKTAEEKDIFAGFSAAAPAAGNGQGNGEININRWVSPDFFISLNAKKSSAEQADAKLFNIGLTYRKVLLFGRKAMIERDQAIAAFHKAPSVGTQKAMEEQLKQVSKRFFLGLFVDGGGRLEGEALNFNVTNAVFDLPLNLVSRTKNVLNDNAYVFFRAVAGVELGRNLRTENDAVKKYYIGRFKYGGELNFVYDPKNPETAFPKRIQLTAQAIDRYLFQKETVFDPKTKKATVFSEGRKPWYQFDLKVYLSESQQGRFGFKVSRIRGGLPPTFNDTRAFTFGAIFESAEDKNK